MRTYAFVAAVGLFFFGGCAVAGEPPLIRQSDLPAPGTAKAVVVPDSVPASVVSRINAERAAFYGDLREVIASDADGLLILTDKGHPLPPGYEPADLISLSRPGVARSYLANRQGLSLRAPAERALERMAAAALADGVTLVVSSSYRSYDYQKTVYERNVRELGQAAADRESARPGTSQHQLGTAVDFGSITDDFAVTKAGRWIRERGGEWGWSLSFPDGYESVTGYRWESWHWRYVGVKAAAFQEKWFDGVQQYMLECVDAWVKSPYSGL